MTAPGINGPLETALYAEDLDRAEDFYGRVLGLPVIAKVAGRHVFFRSGRSVLLIFNPAATQRPPPEGAPLPVPPHGAHGAGHHCFAVDGNTLDGWRRHLQAEGVAIEADFVWPNGARSIYVRDPDGNSIEFADPALWGLTESQ